jgi:excisionase family DNA binding protein
VFASASMEPLDVITPEQLAKQMGWSAKRIRKLARELGACRILGNRMRLTRDDVEAILEATKPKPLGPPVRPRDIFQRPSVRLPDVTYEDLVRMREAAKRKKEAEQRSQRVRQRARMPRAKRPPKE